MVTVFLYAHHLLATPRKQLQRDTSCSCKEIQGHSAFKVDIAVQYVEDILFGKIRGGSCLEGMGDIESSSFIDAGDDAHNDCLSVKEKGYQIVGHTLNLCQWSTVKLCRGIHGIGLTQIFLEVFYECLFFWQLTADIQLIFLLVHP